MTRSRTLRGFRHAVLPFLTFAEEAADEDDLRLRKRIGVAAGYLTIVAPLTLPLTAEGNPVAILVAIALAGFSILNLVVLARTRRFERFVVALVTAGCVFVPVATWLSGGITFASSGLAWGFLIPAYALLALGPSKVGRWYGAFLGVVAAAVVLELLRPPPVAADAYGIHLVGAIANTVGPLTIVFAMLLFSDRRRRQAEARSEELLTNAIPATIARRLKRGEQRIADVYPETTVLFTDLAGFTPWARTTDPTRVAAALDSLFRRFDTLVAGAGMEKIKTIGDSYMAVSGAPEPRHDHATTSMAVAMAMLDAAEAWRIAEDVPLDIRIGLSSGPVAGGVIGRQRILFDLWGDTVNAAARMESSGEPGHIQISAATRALLVDAPPGVTRTVEVKGLGQMATYVVGRRAS